MPDYKGKILIVEDEPAIAQDMCDILEMNGYHVTGTAYSYDKAIEALAADTPDLVFLDIALKGNGSGLDVARKEIFPSIDQINGEIPKPLSPQEYNVLKLIWKGNKNRVTFSA